MAGRRLRSSLAACIRHNGDSPECLPRFATKRKTGQALGAVTVVHTFIGEMRIGGLPGF
jgi:hypothetical protein